MEGGVTVRLDSILDNFVITKADAKLNRCNC